MSRERVSGGAVSIDGSRRGFTGAGTQRQYDLFPDGRLLVLEEPEVHQRLTVVLGR